MQRVPVTCNKQNNKWSRMEYKKYLINHLVIQYMFTFWAESP